MTKLICKAKRYNDEMHCGVCGLIWGIKDDDRPQCKPEQVKRKREFDRALHIANNSIYGSYFSISKQNIIKGRIEIANIMESLK